MSPRRGTPAMSGIERSSSTDTISEIDLSDEGGTPLATGDFRHAIPIPDDEDDDDNGNIFTNGVTLTIEMLGVPSDDEVADEAVSEEIAQPGPDAEDTAKPSLEKALEDAEDQDTTGVLPDPILDEGEEEGSILEVLDQLAEESLPGSDLGDRSRSQTPIPSTPKPTLKKPTLKKPALGNHAKSPARLFPDLNRVIDWIWGRNATFTREDLPEWTDSEGLQDEHQTWRKQQYVGDDFLDIGGIQDICPACTTSYCQAVDSIPFRSCLNLSYNDPETHRWFIGDRYVMTETTDEHPEQMEVPVVEATGVVRRITPVPVPNIIAGWKEHGKIITIAEHIQGQRLYDIWWHLSNGLRERIAKQVARYVDQWRQCRSDRISSLNGGPVWNHDNLFGTAGEGFGPFRSDSDFWHAINQRLEKKKVNEDLIQVLKDYMPESSPCVLTHGDLSSTNIYIKNGRVSAITGFDNAASLPVWAENVAVHFCYCKEDEQWKAILSRHMRSYQAALDWWSLWTAVETLEPDQARIAKLIGRCRRWNKTAIRWQPFLGPDSSEDETDMESPAPDHGQAPPLSRYPEPSPGSPRRDGVIVHMPGVSPQLATTSESFRKALRKELLEGKDYHEFMKNISWESAMDADREEEEEEEEEERDKARRRWERKKRWKLAMRRHDATEDDSPSTVQEREEISRWLPEGTRDTKAPSIPIDLHNNPSDEGQQTTGLRREPRDEDAKSGVGSSQALAPASALAPRRWRPKPFDGSKGLRPLSLPAYPLSDSAKDRLRKINEGVPEGDSSSRAETIEKTLRSLSFIDEEDAVTAGEGEKEEAADATLAQPSHSRAHSRAPSRSSQNQNQNERKRNSIFKSSKNAPPGSLYATLQQQPRRYVRSKSEERMPTRESHGTSGPEGGGRRRPRPLSLLPPQS